VSRCEGIADGNAEGGLELDGLVECIIDNFGDSFEDGYWDGIIDVSNIGKQRSSHIIQMTIRHENVAVSVLYNPRVAHL
jgi:hypothetical protein